MHHCYVTLTLWLRWRMNKSFQISRSTGVSYLSSLLPIPLNNWNVQLCCTEFAEGIHNTSRILLCKPCKLYDYSHSFLNLLPRSYAPFGSSFPFIKSACILPCWAELPGRLKQKRQDELLKQAKQIASKKGKYKIIWLIHNDALKTPKCSFKRQYYIHTKRINLSPLILINFS